MSKLESEFEIIQRYFKKNKKNSSNVLTGIGDDAAVIDISNQSNLVVSIDTLISGVHFPDTTCATDIAYKSLAVNLSDLAAMGATPAWFTLAITLPESNPIWLEDFSFSLFELAKQYNLDLVGGDTTQSPSSAALSITIQIAGYGLNEQIMHRHSAQVNDDIYVSGSIGDAGAGLQLLNEPSISNSSINNYLISRLNRPTARIELGEQIRQYASACIDISDGLLVDLNHIITASSCGATVDVDLLPISNELKSSSFSKNCYLLALDSGDDYELCFTAPQRVSKNILDIANKLDTAITKIGQITKESGIQCFFEKKPYHHELLGYQHFKEKTE